MADRPVRMCNGCDAVWGGNRAAHCAACHCSFTSESAFRAHLVSQVTAGCLDPATATHKRTHKPLLVWNERRQMWSLPPREDRADAS